VRIKNASQKRLRARCRPLFDVLEERVMLDGAPSALPLAIVVGRSLSAQFVGGVQNNQLTITYTVYNEQADPETGVLLTTTLEPGVSLTSASSPPDQSGQDLAWSLGTIPGFDRASVTVTLDLANPIPLQLDSGAHAFATLDAGAVSAATPAAALRAGNVSDPGLLASTPDANATDPFIQEEAAKLNYDPQQIFDFLHSQVGYNSYLGSVRGARGTLWSGAGNALDVASLGVALLRASGIPAEYVQGALSQAEAQQLILSMFPPSFQTVGYIPSGTPTADPANDPQLLSETESHYWFRFDAGSGMQDADPLMPGATVGQTFTSATGTFTEVPDNLREKTEIQLVAELSSAGLFGSQSSDTTVLDHTFNDVDLVGRTLTLGNFVSQSSGGFIFTATTNTYSPYLAVGDEANPDPRLDEVIRGTDYQEVLTNFPFGSQILTGLFLNISLSGPQGPAETTSRTLFDRIGYAARQGGGSSSLSVSPGSAPAVGPLEMWTISAQASRQSPTTIGTSEAQGQADGTVLSNLVAAGAADTSAEEAAVRNVLIDESQAYLVSLLATSDAFSGRLDSTTRIQSYFARPRITIMGANLTPNGSQGSRLSFEADLRRDTIAAFAAPGQSLAALVPFQTARGLLEAQIESNLFPQPPAGSQLQVQYQASTSAVFAAATAQGIPIVALTAQNQSALQAIAISADAKARITTALQAGKQVLVPAKAPTIDGAPAIAWYEVDPTTGETIGVGEDGTHQDLITYGIIGAIAAVVLALLPGPLGSIAADLKFDSLIPKYQAYLDAALNQTRGSYSGAYKDAKHIALAEFVQDVNAAIADAQNMKGLPAYKAAYIATLKDDLYNFVLAQTDPPAQTSLLVPPPAVFFPPSLRVSDATESAGLSAGALSGTVQSQSISTTGVTAASWSTSAANGFQAATVAANGATVRNANGAIVGTGTVALAAAGLVAVSVAGNDQYQVQGAGSLSFYGAAGSSLGVSGNWGNYTAKVTGNVSISLTTGALALNGQPLPADLYTIAASAATLTGSGPSTSPDLAGSAAITVANGTVNLGPASGSLTAGGAPLDISGTDTFTGYSGALAVSAGPSGTDSVGFTGNAANVITVSGSPAVLTADQNHPAAFQVNADGQPRNPLSQRELAPFCGESRQSWLRFRERAAPAHRRFQLLAWSAARSRRWAGRKAGSQPRARGRPHAAACIASCLPGWNAA
jgi:transglutaminase-like putative cysteine protease